MQGWKKNIFARVIRVRMDKESRPAEKIIQEYKLIPENEAIEILVAIRGH